MLVIKVNRAHFSEVLKSNAEFSKNSGIYAWVDVLWIKSEGVGKQNKNLTYQRIFPQRKRRETPEICEQGQKQGTTLEVTLTVLFISSLYTIQNDFIFIVL